MKKVNMKKLLLIVTAIIFIVSSFTVYYVGAKGQTSTVSARMSGKIGKTLTWTLDKKGTLTVDGEGTMPDYNCLGFEGYDLTAASYSTNTPWAKQRESIKKVVIKDGVKNIGKSAFTGLTKVESVTIGKGITKITNEAFAYCHSLKTVKMSDSVTEIGADAFLQCYKLKTVNMPKKLKTIRDGAFCACYCLEDVTFPAGVKTIEDNAFKYCKAFETVTIPEKVTTVSDYAFAYCENVGAVKLHSKITKIGTSAFCGCEKLGEITIPASVKSIGSYAFSGISGIKTVTLNEGLEKIGAGAFEGSGEIKSVKIPKSVTKVGQYAFGYVSVGEEDDTEHLKRINFKMYVYPGTAGEKYAKNNGFKTINMNKHKHEYEPYHYFASFKSDGKIVYTCDCRASYNEKIAKVATVKLSKTSYTYDGKAHKPTVTVKDADGKTLKKGAEYDYTVSYSGNCKDVGKYTVTVTLKGNYEGKKTLTFKIVPKGTSISKLSAGKNRITVKWDEQKTQTSGYQIEYSTSKNMKNSTKKAVSSSNATSAELEKLDGKTTYFVRIRTYKTVKFQGKTMKIYSSWSDVRSVKTK